MQLYGTVSKHRPYKTKLRNIQERIIFKIISNHKCKVYLLIIEHSIILKYSCTFVFLGFEFTIKDTDNVKAVSLHFCVIYVFLNSDIMEVW